MANRRLILKRSDDLQARAGQPAVGRGRAHDSAELHVSGLARYVDDIIEPQGTVHVAPGYASATCGTITSMDLDAVKSAPGVIAVLTAADVPGVNDCSPVMGDDPILAGGRIEFHGQVVFAVVAETRDQALRAARLAAIEVAAEDAALTVAQAKAASKEVLPPYRFRRGAVEAAIEGAPHRLRDRFSIGGQDHFYLEGQVSLAIPTDAGGIAAYSSTQHPSEVQHIIARMLGLPDALVTCECRRMGGAFGGKETQAAQWAALASLAAHVTGRAAKMRLDRDDDMRMTGKRHDFDVAWQAGYDEAGRLLGVSTELASRCGYSADLSMGVNDRAMFHADNAYFYEAVDIKSYRLRTNTVSNTAFRGFGGPQGLLFAERMMQAIAIERGMDSLDVRYANLYGPGRATTPYGQEVEDNEAPDIMRQLEASSDYRARRQQVSDYNARSRWLKKGLALTPVKFGISFTLKHLNQAGALVHVFGDGSVQLNHGGTEMGQGLYIKVAQVVADAFGIPLDMVRITATTTDKVPNASPTAASAGSDLNGMAALNAARTIKDRMVATAARLYQVSPGDVTIEDGIVQAGDHRLTFGELAKQCILERVQLSATGFYATPKITWDRDAVRGRPFLYFAYGAACAEVTIDTLTGEMVVDRVDILHDVGRSLNPAIDRGQIEGGFVQGMGWLTTEELVFDDAGRLRTHAPSTYKVPTASDLPKDFRVALYDSAGNREDTIHRSKAVGEPPLMLATSVWCAVMDAIASLRPGTVPPLNAPATPEAILTAVTAMKATHG